MPDLEISKLPLLTGAGLQAVDQLAVADASAAETKRIAVKELIKHGFALADRATLPADRLDWTGVSIDIVSGATLTDRSLPGVKLEYDSVTALEIAPNAVGTSELANGAVDTAALQLKAVTTNQIADDAITELQVASKAITASKLANGAVDTVAVVDGAITLAKLSASSVGTAALVDKSVTAVKVADHTLGALQIAPGAITTSELSGGAVDTVNIVNAAVTNSKLASDIDGLKLADDSITAAKVAPASLDRGIDKVSGAIGHANSIAAGVRNGISYDAHGHVTGSTTLASADLPIATDLLVGAASFPSDSGLTVSGVGAVAHTNSVSPATHNGVTYDKHGHITATASLAPSDLPVATAATVGGVSVAGPALVVNAAGVLSHGGTTVTPGTYVKLTVNGSGHITAGAALTAADLPTIDASMLNSGVLDIARLADRSVTQQKLSDYSFAYIQEAVPPTGVNSHPIGMIWLQESTGQVSVWNGNSWMKTGASTLFNRNLRYGGTYNAATGVITGVTQFGTAEGVQVGDSVLAADDKIAGLYFVASAGGSSSGLAGGAVMDAGDWLLCHGTRDGWVRIDTLSGAGGGSSASHLDDLLDVTLTAVAADQLLVSTVSGQWVNKSVASIVPSASQTAKGIIQLATAAEVLAGTDLVKAVTPKEANAHYLAKNIALLAALP